MSDFDHSKLFDFLELMGKLKHEKRTGWVIKDVADCESIAGHMYRMGIMTFFLNGSDNLDRFKCLQMTLVHDLAECIVGDITPHCGITPEEKHKREDEAMKQIAELTGSSGTMLYDLYKEYENQTSPEAKYVKELDRLDMIMQAYEYEKRDNNPQSLEEFFTATKGKFSHPFVIGISEELNKRRAKLEGKITEEKPVETI